MLTKEQKDALRALPAVNVLLQNPDLQTLINESNFELVSTITSNTVEQLREEILKNGEPPFLNISTLLTNIKESYDKITTPHLTSVVNGTGVILHTNLGRAKLSKEAIEAVQSAAANYSNLEYRLEEGTRGSRYEHVEDLLVQLTGAEAAVVVNNNAAAVILILKEMAQGEEVIVSRGQLVEIGGSFRVSEIMEQSGAKLVEVGTTNKTHSFDYERAITEQTGLLMKVHTSNFKIVGFTKEVSLTTLVELGQQHQLPVYEDLGSGVLYDLKQHGIGQEPTVQETVKAGADIVSFSGDKLLGGPQTGIIVGKKKWIDRIKKNQLTRSLRVDKMTLAALEATLRHYQLNQAVDKIPTLKMILMDLATIEQKAKKLIDFISPVLLSKATLELIDGYSEIGGGSFPDEKLPTKLVAIQPVHLPINKFEQKLRIDSPHIIGRIMDDKFHLDVRTTEESEFILIKEKLERIFS